ncbi:hypothetical protein HMPREF3188_01360 [Tissierellia bacterium KA00581]|nr:hypothetical protein HMPREF3188_01360 [Tissierellia bacterium KA00581]
MNTFILLFLYEKSMKNYIDYIYFKNDIYLKKNNLLAFLKMFLISIILLIVASIIEGTMIYTISNTL